MKIAYVTTQFPAPSETFACNDVRTLKNLGMDVFVFSLKPKHKHHSQMILDRGIENISVNSCGILEAIQGFFLSIFRLSLALKLLVWLIKYDYNKPSSVLKCIALIPASFSILHKLEKTKPDVVHLFWGHYPSLVGYLVKRRMPETQLTMFLGAYDLEMELGISSWLAQRVNMIFTHTAANCQQLEKLHIDIGRVRVIHRGVDVEQLQHHLLSTGEKKNKLLLTAARLIKIKRVDTVLKVLSLLPEHNLRIAGDGAEYTNLIATAKSLGIGDKVEFLGFLNHQNLLPNMSEAGFFLLLSDRERLPNAVKEAMFSGCVCIVSDTPGITELIEHGKTGFIIPPHNEAPYIANLISRLSDVEINLLGKNARSFIINHFDVRVSMQKYITAWTLTKDEK